MDDELDLTETVADPELYDEVEMFVLRAIRRLGPSSLEVLAKEVQRAWPTGFSNLENVLPLALTGNALGDLAHKKLVQYHAIWTESRHTRHGWEKNRSAFSLTFEGWVTVLGHENECND